MRLLDDPIRASYVGILILITLLIVFAASWMGIYLARQITVPVQLLAEGTEEVARGNLDVSLDYQSSDEFGTLVASFNRMTADLKAMKGNLEETNASLTRTYDELRRRTQFIETILHSISTGVIVIDRHGRISMINKVAERLLRIPKDGAVGRMYREVLREEHYEAIRGLYREAGEAAGGQIERQVELVVGEKRIAFRVSLTALRDDAGEYMGLVAAFDDLSQAMRLQRVLAWREVARRIAHDIRNPLTPIQLSTERMQRKYAAAHAEDPVFAECTQAILSEVNTLKHLVDEFTRFARMPVPHLDGGGSPDGDSHRRGHVPDVPPGDPVGVPPGRPAARLVRPVPDPARRHQPARQRRGRPRGAGERHGHRAPTTRRRGRRGSTLRTTGRGSRPGTATASSSRIFRAGRGGRDWGSPS